MKIQNLNHYLLARPLIRVYEEERVYIILAQLVGCVPQGTDQTWIVLKTPPGRAGSGCPPLSRRRTGWACRGLDSGTLHYRHLQPSPLRASARSLVALGEQKTRIYFKTDPSEVFDNFFIKLTRTKNPPLTIPLHIAIFCGGSRVFELSALILISSWASNSTELIIIVHNYEILRYRRCIYEI